MRGQTINYSNTATRFTDFRHSPTAHGYQVQKDINPYHIICQVFLIDAKGALNARN